MSLNSPEPYRESIAVAELTTDYILDQLGDYLFHKKINALLKPHVVE